MTNEEYYGQMKLLFQHKGWEYLQEDLRSNYSVINDIIAATDENDLFFRKGQMAVLSYLINLSDTIALAEAEQDSPSEDPEG